MSTKTSIEWTATVHPDGTVTPGKTWNPVTGCAKVSPGCAHCYAEGVAARFWASQYPEIVDTAAAAVAGEAISRPREFTDVMTHEDRLLEPLKWRKPSRIFVNSMSDLFHEDVPDEFIDRVFAVMALAPQHTFQILTKRPDRMRAYCSDSNAPGRVARAVDAMRVAASVPEDEEIRPIDWYQGYFASSHGHIYSERRGARRRMKPDVGEQGHMRVQLHRPDGGKRGDRHLVHRLILQVFVGPPPTPDAQGCHRDGNPTNNAVANLTWGDQSENWQDRKRHGNYRAYSKLSDASVEAIRARARAGESAYSIAKDFNVSDTQVRNIIAGRQWATESGVEWPLKNVWKGVSVENQRFADERIPMLLQTPAAVRFISAEPLLGPVDLARYLTGEPRLDWVIVGGES